MIIVAGADVFNAVPPFVIPAHVESRGNGAHAADVVSRLTRSFPFCERRGKMLDSRLKLRE